MRQMPHCGGNRLIEQNGGREHEDEGTEHRARARQLLALEPAQDGPEAREASPEASGDDGGRVRLSRH